MLSPDFIAKITLYSTEKGGRQSPLIGEQFGCLCKFDEKDFSAWDCRILVGGERFYPGETKNFGIKFMTPEAGALFRVVKKFYLWESKIIGEATAMTALPQSN